MAGSAKIHPEFRGYGSASHGVCYLCRMSRRPDEVVVDLGVELDGLDPGSLQVCSGCVKHLGRLVGMVGPEKAAGLRDQLDKMSGFLDDESERARAAEAALNALVTFKSARSAK